MANLNSNVITLKKLKETIVKKTDVWTGNTVKRFINTKNNNDLCVHLSEINVLGSTSVRYLSVKGHTDIDDAGVFIQGTGKDGSIYKAERYTITASLFSDIYFDVSTFNFVSIEVQLNANQDLKLSVSDQKPELSLNNLIVPKTLNGMNIEKTFDATDFKSGAIYVSNLQVSLATSVRNIEVRGKNDLSDAGEYIPLFSDNNTVIGAGLYQPTRDISLYFDLTKYKYVTIKSQFNTNQSLNLYFEKRNEELTFDYTKDFIGRINTNGYRYIRYSSSLINNTTTTTFTIKGYNEKGEATDLEAASYRAYSTTPNIPAGISNVDFMVDVSKFIEVEFITITHSRFVGRRFSLFNDISEEYKEAHIKSFAGQYNVRGFNFIKVNLSDPLGVYNFINERGTELPIYDVNGQYLGKANYRPGSSRYVVIETRGSSVVTMKGTYANQIFDFSPLIDFNPPKEYEYVKADKMKIIKRNATTPSAELGRYRAYYVFNSNSIRITNTGQDYLDCEYEALISEFPNIQSGVSIINMVFIPYTRNINFNHHGRDVRLCVQFSDGSIYHNFPNRTPVGGRADGDSIAGDIARFDQSVVWDSNKTASNIKFPSKTVPSDSTNYYYDPTLMDSNYEIYPPLNVDNGYGHGGFGIVNNNRVRLRKEGYKDIVRGLNFPEIDKMYTAVDSYRNTIKNCVFETSDGGRQWFVQADLGTAYNFGNINTSDVGAFDGSVSIKKVTLIQPNDAVKDPVNKFELSADIPVTNISNDLNPTIDVSAHGLVVGDRIIFTGSSTNFGFILNNSHTVNNSGNGQVYRVSQVINANSIKIQPLAGNTNTNLVCAHVHSVNRIKEGWIMCTGEEYPNGWIIYISQKPRDFYSNATSAVYRDWVRLTSSPNAVQRLVGCVVLDDDNLNPTVIASMDTFNINMPMMKVGDRDVYSKSSGGIRMGRLSDLDDITKFQVVSEMDDSGIGMKRYNDVIYCFGGGSGRFSVSPDNGKTWYLQHWTDAGYRFPTGLTSAGEFVLDGNYVIKKG